MKGDGRSEAWRKCLSSGLSIWTDNYNNEPANKASRRKADRSTSAQVVVAGAGGPSALYEEASSGAAVRTTNQPARPPSKNPTQSKPANTLSRPRMSAWGPGQWWAMPHGLKYWPCRGGSPTSGKDADRRGAAGVMSAQAPFLAGAYLLPALGSRSTPRARAGEDAGYRCRALSLGWYVLCAT